jgi:hypothetical protein
MELDKFIKMIPGSIRKRVHVDLNKLGNAFMGENALGNSGGDKGLEDTEGVPSRATAPHPFQGGEAGEPDTGGSGGTG